MYDFVPKTIIMEKREMKIQVKSQGTHGQDRSLVKSSLTMSMRDPRFHPWKMSLWNPAPVGPTHLVVAYVAIPLLSDTAMLCTLKFMVVYTTIH
jgi:hypothetical protein